MVQPDNLKLLIIGHGRHGKDTVAEILHDMYGLKFISSSMYASKRVVFPALQGLYGYKDSEECFSDRHNHRAEWFDLITAYNTPDKARLATCVMDTNDIYVGMRNEDELKASRHLFDFIIWVDASARHSIEHSDSCAVTHCDADIVLDNNGTLDDLTESVIHMYNSKFCH